MKKYCYSEPGGERGETNIVREFTIQEILDDYWDYWKEEMIKKYGEGHELITEAHCVEDWVTVHGAWEIDWYAPKEPQPEVNLKIKNLGIDGFPSCKTCKYWNAKYSPTDFPNIRRCSKPIMYWDAREWVNEDNETVSKMKDEHKDLMMFVQDGSDYYAELITREDFFCAHWEKIDE